MDAVVIPILVAAIVVIFLVAASVRIVPQARRYNIERFGRYTRTLNASPPNTCIKYENEAAFADNSHLLRIIDKIVSQIGRRVDEASPMVDARLPDGSRVNAIIPPNPCACNAIFWSRTSARYSREVRPRLRMSLSTSYTLSSGSR